MSNGGISRTAAEAGRFRRARGRVAAGRVVVQARGGRAADCRDIGPAPNSVPARSERRPAVAMSPPAQGDAQRFQYVSGTVGQGRLDRLLNDYGKRGWQLRTFIPNRTATGYLDGTFFVLLERSRPDTSHGRVH